MGTLCKYLCKFGMFLCSEAHLLQQTNKMHTCSCCRCSRWKHCRPRKESSVKHCAHATIACAQACIKPGKQVQGWHFEYCVQETCSRASGDLLNVLQLRLECRKQTLRKGIHELHDFFCSNFSIYSEMSHNAERAYDLGAVARGLCAQQNKINRRKQANQPLTTHTRGTNRNQIQE